MGISESPNCFFCPNIETIEHIYTECENVIELWKNTEKWVRRIYSPHSEISDTEKIFGERNSGYIKQTIIISVKDVKKRKNGDELNLADVKRGMLKNLPILRTQESTSTQISSFDNNWRIFIDCLNTDLSTQHSWYKIQKFYTFLLYML